MDVKINYTAVGTAAFVMFLIGWAWYMTFGNLWMAYTGMTMEMAEKMTGMDIAKTYGGSFVAYLILFYCLSHVNHAFQVKDIKGGAMSGFWSWLGFTVTALFVSYSYQGKAFGLVLIDGGYWLVGMVVGGMILSKMQKKETSAN
jgi:hypothetical protein